MKTSVTKIVGFKKITVGFFIVLSIVAVNALFSTLSLQKNRAKINKTINVLTPYVETMEKFNLMVTRSKMLATNWVYLQANELDKESLKQLHNVKYPEIKKEILSFPSQLEESKDTKKIDSILLEFEDLLFIEKDLMASLAGFDDYEDPLTKFSAEATIEEEILPRSEKIFTDLGVIIDNKRKEMNTLKDSMLASFSQLVFSVIFTSVALFLLVYLAGLFIRKSITSPVLKMNNIIHRLGRGEIPDEQLEVSDDVIGDMTHSVNILSSSFKTTSIFANQIGSGNLRAEFKPLSEKDLLGNALINMRENLREYAEDMEKKVEERTLELQREKEKVEFINLELEKLSIVASETDNAIVIANHTGEIEWVNSGFIKLFGYDLDEFKSACGGSLLDASKDPDIRVKMEHSIAQKTPVIYEVENQTKSGEKLWIQSTMTPILDENGHIKKLVVIDSNITAQKEAEMVVVEQNKDILDSIHYAKRIQQAILPSNEQVKKAFDNFFVFFRPKDIVSGDFYWFHRVRERDDTKILSAKYVFAAVDCTGHGVPGAFMSMIGNNVLNTIVIEERETDAGQILTLLNRYIKKALHQDGTNEDESRDGMDVAIIVVDPMTNTFQYAGANRPLYIVKPDNGNIDFTSEDNLKLIQGPGCYLEEIKADKQAIGGLTDNSYTYTTQSFDICEGLAVYLTSDGYCDQFGGPNTKKFMTKRFKQMVCDFQHLSMEEQGKLIVNEFDTWMGETPQIDDILVSGFRLDQIKPVNQTK
jgi:PAS domain S-box-containing protein